MNRKGVSARSTNMGKRKTHQVDFEELSNFYCKHHTKNGVFLAIYHPNMGGDVDELNETFGLDIKAEDDVNIVLVSHDNADNAKGAIESAKRINNIGPWAEVWVDGKRTWKPEG